MISLLENRHLISAQELMAINAIPGDGEVGIGGGAKIPCFGGSGQIGDILLKNQSLLDIVRALRCLHSGMVGDSGKFGGVLLDELEVLRRQSSENVLRVNQFLAHQFLFEVGRGLLSGGLGRFRQAGKKNQ